MARRTVYADAHCHLDQLEDAPKEIAAAKKLGVKRFLSSSEDLASMKRNLALAHEFPGVVLPGLGIHPAELVDQDNKTVAEELDFIKAHVGSASFLGEIGLDFLHAATPVQQDRQKKILVEQFEIAAAAELPVVIHSRRAQRPAMNAAFRYVETYGQPALLHWFTQSVKLLLEVNRRPGVYISAGPAVLFNAGARKVVAHAILDRLLIETDAPVPFGGEPARPSWIPRVVETIAGIFRISPEELAKQLNKNLDRFLGFAQK